MHVAEFIAFLNGMKLQTSYVSFFRKELDVLSILCIHSHTASSNFILNADYIRP